MSWRSLQREKEATPSFARVFRSSDQRLTAGRRAWLARAQARFCEDRQCCDKDCFGAFQRRPRLRRQTRLWQAAWARVPTYARQGALLAYFHEMLAGAVVSAVAMRGRVAALGSDSEESEAGDLPALLDDSTSESDESIEQSDDDDDDDDSRSDLGASSDESEAPGIFIDSEDAPRCSYTFLGERVCQAAWGWLAGVGRGQFLRVLKWARVGVREPPKITRERASVVCGALLAFMLQARGRTAEGGTKRADSCSGVLGADRSDRESGKGAEVCEGLAEPLPAGSRRATLGRMYLPFKHKVTLYRYVVGVYEEELSQGRQLIPQRPAYSTFSSITRALAFRSRVRFLQPVWQARAPPSSKKEKEGNKREKGKGKGRGRKENEKAKCATCCLLKFLLRTSGRDSAVRARYERRYMAHLRLTQESKQVYYRLRAEAMLKFPDYELFLTMDGGTGDQYTLPHQSALSGPISKAIKRTAPHFKAPPAAAGSNRRAQAGRAIAGRGGDRGDAGRGPVLARFRMGARSRTRFRMGMTKDTSS